MSLSRNAMEAIVYENVDKEMKKVGCCTCPACRDDVITYALNRLPPKYSATRQGEIMTRIDATESQLAVDILFFLSEGAKIVRDNPKHDAERLEESDKNRHRPYRAADD